MDMVGEQRIDATRDHVWQALNDPEILKRCLPGCEVLEKSSETEFQAKAVIRIGPVSARFSGVVTLSECDPPNGYVIAGEAKGGAAGVARGSARVRLEADGAATRLHYDVHAAVGGKLAQLGARLIDATARKLADDFFARFLEAVEAAGGPPPVAGTEPADPATPEGGSSGSGLRPMVWISGIIAIVLILIIIFQ